MNPQKPRKSGSHKIADFHAFVEMKTMDGELIFAIVWTSGDDGRTARAFHVEPKAFSQSLIRAIASGAGQNAKRFKNHAGFIDKRCRLGSLFNKMRGKKGTCPTCGHDYRIEHDAAGNPPSKPKPFVFGKGTAAKTPKTGHNGVQTKKTGDDTDS